MANIRNQIFVAILAVVACHQQVFAEDKSAEFDMNEFVDQRIEEYSITYEKYNEFWKRALAKFEAAIITKEQNLTIDYSNVIRKHIQEMLIGKESLSEECSSAVGAFSSAYKVLMKKSHDCVNEQNMKINNSHKKANEFINETINEVEHYRPFTACKDDVQDSMCIILDTLYETISLKTTNVISMIAASIQNINAQETIDLCYNSHVLDEKKNYESVKQKAERCLLTGSSTFSSVE